MAHSILDRVRMAWVKEDTWPPPHVRDHWEQIEAYRRRYRNDKTELLQWAPNINNDANKVSTYTPVGWPREICRFSAALLFSESPQVDVGDALKPALAKLLEVNDFGAFAILGGVKAASEGRVGIRVIRDDVIDRTTPLLTLIPEDQIVWDIRHGTFYAGGMVVITRQPDHDKPDVYRLLEEHTSGSVTRKLYLGDERDLGKEVALTALDEFNALKPVESTGLDKPTLIPWENVPGHESDLFGMGPLFDELNEAESLLLDRARKSIPRVFVDRSLADEAGKLDIDGYIFTGGAKMRMPLGQTAASTVEVVQPHFLSAEHIEWVDHITQLMVTTAGYSPLTWGIQGKTASIARAVSGYAMKLSQLRTLLQRSAKEHMALQALGWATATALCMMDDGHTVSDYLPDIELGDGLPNDPLDGAQEVAFLRQAAAASTETLVQTVHPTWGPEAVEAEVQLNMDDDANPPGAGPALGLGPIPRRVTQVLDENEDPTKRAGAGVDPAPRSAP
jgi:hypothetical protein